MFDQFQWIVELQLSGYNGFFLAMNQLTTLMIDGRKLFFIYFYDGTSNPTNIQWQ